MDFAMFRSRCKYERLADIKKLKFIQFFTLYSITNMLAENVRVHVRFGRSDAFSGLSYTAATKTAIARFDTSLADILPSEMVSGWYFVFRRNN